MTLPTNLISQLFEFRNDLDKVVAVDYDHKISWTWRQLLQKADSIKEKLDQSSTGGGLVLCLSSHSAAFIACMMGAWIAGKTFMPVSDQLSPSEWAQLLPRLKNHYGHIIILTEENLFKLNGLDSSIQIVYFDPQQALANQNFDVKLISLDHLNNDRPALLLMTSGTTAEPRILGFSHQTLVEGARTESDCESWTTETILANLRPHFTSAGLNTLWPFFIKSFTVVFSEKIRKTPIQRFLIDFLIQTKTDHLILSPTYISELLKQGVADLHSETNLKKIYFGGQPLPASVLQSLQLTGIEISMRYGMTEFLRIISKVAYQKTQKVEPSFIGQVARGVQMRLNQEYLEIKAKGLFDFDLSENKIKKMDTDRWYTTFDQIDKVTEQGLYLVGRSPVFIEVSGFRFNRLEVENAIRQHPQVYDVLLQKIQKKVVAFILLKDETNNMNLQSSIEQQIQKKCSEDLSPYKRPDQFIFLKSWPVSVNGKIDLKALNLLVVN